MQLALLMGNVPFPSHHLPSLFTSLCSFSRLPASSLPSPSQGRAAGGEGRAQPGCWSLGFDSQALLINQMPAELGGGRQREAEICQLEREAPRGP